MDENKAENPTLAAKIKVDLLRLYRFGESNVKDGRSFYLRAVITLESYRPSASLSAYFLDRS